MSHITAEERSWWGPGPWASEPDELRFVTSVGLPGFLLRTPGTGTWCGYAGIPNGHQLYGLSHNDDALAGILAHHGLTFAGEREEYGDPSLWWFGFDCGHAGDLMPGMQRHSLRARDRAMRSALGREPLSPEQEAEQDRIFGSAFDANAGPFGPLVYRTTDYVKAQVELVAMQLVAYGT